MPGRAGTSRGTADRLPLGTALLQPWSQSRGWLAFLLEGTLDTRGLRLGKAPVSYGLQSMQSSLDVRCHRLREDGGRGSQIKTKGGRSSMRLGEADPFCGRDRTGAGQV